jgi:type I restriction enzyme S subunit
MESGGTPSRSRPDFWNEGTINWFKTKELWDTFLFQSEEKISNTGLEGSSARLFEAGTILMAIYGSPTVGRLGILTEPSACNQAALGMVSDDAKCSQVFLFFALSELREHFNRISQGAAQQNISKEKVARTQILLPPSQLMFNFNVRAIPLFDQIRTMKQQMGNLRQTRDLLLPHLLSGQIDLKSLED